LPAIAEAAVVKVQLEARSSRVEAGAANTVAPAPRRRAERGCIMAKMRYLKRTNKKRSNCYGPSTMEVFV